MSDKGLKRAVIIGATAGAVLSLAAALGMDVLLSDSLQGTWRDAAARDVTRMFGPACGRNWFAVTLTLVVTLGFLAAVGAVLGVIGGVIIHRFFTCVLK